MVSLSGLGQRRGRGKQTSPSNPLSEPREGETSAARAGKANLTPQPPLRTARGETSAARSCASTEGGAGVLEEIQRVRANQQGMSLLFAALIAVGGARRNRQVAIIAA